MSPADPERRLQVGGTLNPRRHVYIERPQDAELLRLLLAGEYASVLTSRQMGKSSLMVRTAVELAARGVRFATVDMAGLGTSPEPGPWYLSLVEEIARGLKLELDVPAWWHALDAQTDNQKLLCFCREVIAQRIAGPVVIFLDEIDATLRLPYADDLFTALRTLYNERPLEPTYERVTFCLLGVATPNELIKQRRTTPYNIGRTLSLRDFDEDEDDLSPLAGALGDDLESGRAVLRRILDWTGGHPYLTVKLCEEMLNLDVREPAEVDAYVERTFVDLDRLGPDVHFRGILRFLEERTADRRAMLALYARVLRGGVERDLPDLAHSQLKLSGLVKRDAKGLLVVRNRLYRRLFDARWIQGAKPGPALRWAPVAALTGALLVLGLLALAVLDPVRVLALTPGQPLARELAPGGVHRFALPLQAGQYLDLRVEQQGIDVTVALFDPGRVRLIQVDTPQGAFGPERLLALAPASGEYRLEVRASGAGREPGRYEVKVRELRAATEVDLKRVVAVAALARGREQVLAGRPEAALRDFEQALRGFQRLGDFSGQNETLDALGSTYRMLGRNREAIEVYRRALPLSQEEAATHFRLGELLLKEGEIPEAVAQFERAQSLWRQVGDRRRVAGAAQALGTAYLLRGNVERALSFYTQAVAVSREIGDRPGSADALRFRGELYLAQGRAAEAQDDLAAALDLYRTAGNLERQAITLGALGRTSRETGDLEQAMESFQRALELWRQQGHRRGESNALLDLGHALAETDEDRRSVEIFERARRLARESGDRWTEAGALNGLGRLHAKLGDPARAVALYRQALLLWEQLGNRAGRAEALLGMAEVERRGGALSAAGGHLLQALDIIESQRFRPRSPDLRSSSLLLQRRAYDLLVDVLMEQGLAAEALAVAEQARTHSLLLSLGDIGQSAVDPTLLRRQQELETRIRDLEAWRLRAGEVGDRAASERLEREMRSLLSEREAVLSRICVQSPRYAALIQPRSLSAREIQTTVVDEETLLLEYALGEERSFLWAVTPGSIHGFKLPPRDVIEAAARRAYAVLASPGSSGRDPADPALRALGEMLLGPVAGELGGKRLLIVGDGALAYVPFSALPSPGGSAEPLVARHEIVGLPSASTLTALRREPKVRPPVPGAVAVIADPAFDRRDPRLRDLSRLPSTRQEARAILSLVRGQPKEARLVTGEAANEQVIASDDLARYRILHFATHTLFDNRRPERSGIALSAGSGRDGRDDGFLSSAEVYDLDLAAELVVLSAGSTSLGREIHGEGLTGLTRGFLFAGAKGVVAGLWPVDDRATAEFMEHFYRGVLVERLPPAAALRRAQLRMRSRGHSPGDWAAFVFQGDWR